MSIRATHRLFGLLTIVALVSPFQSVLAQLEHLSYQHKYDKGQTIQPIFQGWSRNADGTFDMHFGYLNRNYSEELHIPIGTDNFIDMAGLDNIQNQPTYFHARENRDIFTVTVPADFGNREIVWRVATQGKTLEAIGWLQSEWEIDEYGGYTPEPDVLTNKPPVINLPDATSIRLPAKLTLTATVSDDGLPKPKVKVAKTEDTSNREDWNNTPLLTRPAGALEIPVNVPHLQTNVRGTKVIPTPPRDKLTISYSVWRGPSKISAEPMFAEVTSGSATTEITFTEPGEYQLRVRAFDGGKSSYEFISVNVQ
jgi:hypothetical protein